jgi:hypothetical protein
MSCTNWCLVCGYDEEGGVVRSGLSGKLPDTYSEAEYLTRNELIDLA